MRKICICLSKGGVGKSSTAVSLAHGLSMKGKKVLLIDTDEQGQCGTMLGVSPKYTIADVIEEKIGIKEAIFKARDNLYILAGGPSLALVKKAIGQKDHNSEKTLMEACNPIEGKYDFVLMDTSPSFDALTVNCLFYANEIMIPVSLEPLTLNSLTTFVKRIQGIHKYHPNLKLNYVIPTFEDNRVKKSSEILKILKQHYPDILCPPIRYSVRISESSGHGQTIFEYSPKDRGAQDYKKLVNMVLKHE